jgi:signal transduction histidine kinase
MAVLGEATAVKRPGVVWFRYASLRQQLLWGILIPTLATVGLGSSLLFSLARDALEDELGRSLASQAAVIAAGLKAERVLALDDAAERAQPSRLSKSLSTQLADAQRAAQLRRVFVFDNVRRVRLDTAGQLPFMAEMPELLRDSVELERVFSNEPIASQILFEDEQHRQYKTGYAPIVLDGEVVLAVGVEGSAKFFGPLTVLRNGFVGLGVLTAVLLLLAIAWSTRLLSMPVSRLVQSASRMTQGDLATPVAAESGRELMILSRAFEQMRNALEQREREQKMMLGGIAHEVRNPLGGIELFAGLLHEALAEEPSAPRHAVAHVEKIQKETARLKQLVDDFLKFSREHRLDVTDFSSVNLVAEVVARLPRVEQGLELKVLQHVEPCALRGDESLLSTALLNVIQNAVQASVENAAVTVSGRRAEGVYVFEVTDSGPGIPVEQQSVIFELFYTTKQQGSGFGLALTKKFLEAHQGTVSLRSVPGETVFTLTLPT